MTQHNHIWTYYDGGWSCAECTEQSPTCIVNTPIDDEHGHPTGIPAQNICTGCLTHEQAILDHVADALGHWQHQPRSLVPAIRYDRDRTTGSRNANDRPSIQTPADILDVLWDWADMWAEARDAHQPRDTTELIAWLKRHTLWAANNSDTSAFDDYRTEMRQMRHHARRVSGLLPKRLAGPCIHCGGEIVQDWATPDWKPRIDHENPDHNGLSDTHRCTGCGLTWQHREAWMYANRHTLQILPDVKADALVTLDDARKHIWPHVPASTWRTWQDRAGLTPHGQDVHNRPLYRVSDLEPLVQRRADTTRAGRRAG